MNNLVSKNPVQRFKQGRKIIFAKPGDKMLYNGKEVVTEEILDGQIVYRRKNGSYVYSNDKLLSPIKQNSQVSPSIKPSDVTVNIPKFSPENTEFVPQYQKDVTHNWLEGLRNKYVRPSFQKTTAIPQQQTQTQKTNTKVTSKTISKTPINWDTEFYNQFTKNLTGQQRAYLDNAGVDYSNAASMQEYLKNKGFDLGKSGVDARWGKNSMKAWNDFVSKTNFGPTLPSNISSVISTIPAPIDTSKININMPQQTYDRTGIREYLRSKGLNPYSFSGAQRRALRMVMNGTANENDKILAKEMGIFKQGGSLLPSRNPVKRFKSQRKGL